MRRCFFAALLGLLGFCLVAPAGAAVPRDLDDPTRFHDFTRLGDRVVFLGFLSSGGQCGLWATDGTAAGTERLADLCAGSPDPLEDSTRLRILGAAGPLAFLLDGSAQLWRTDGTSAGTLPLGVTVSTFNGETLVAPEGLLYFAACNAAGDCEPWRSDGTAAGTRLLRAVQAGARGSSEFLRFAADGDRVVLSGAGPGGPALWITDGTSRGTQQIARFPEPIGSLAVAADGALYVSTRSSLYFIPQGGSAARRIARFHLDFRSPGVTFVQAGGRLLYVGGEEEVADLWEIDTLHHRPRFLARFESGFGPVTQVGGGVLLAAGSDPSNPNLYLWFLASGAAHPSLVSGCPEGCPSVESAFGTLGGRIFFAGRDGRGSELWETDGTGAGTRLLKDLCPGECDGSPGGFAPVLGKLIFAAGGIDLWVTDGSAAGTTQLGQILSSGAGRLDAAELNGRVVFNGFDDTHGSQPWVSDLTPEGTMPLVIPGGAP